MYIYRSYALASRALRFAWHSGLGRSLCLPTAAWACCLLFFWSKVPIEFISQAFVSPQRAPERSTKTLIRGGDSSLRAEGRVVDFSKALLARFRERQKHTQTPLFANPIYGWMEESL